MAGLQDEAQTPGPAPGGPGHLLGVSAPLHTQSSLFLESPPSVPFSAPSYSFIRQDCPRAAPSLKAFLWPSTAQAGGTPSIPRIPPSTWATPCRQGRGPGSHYGTRCGPSALFRFLHRVTPCRGLVSPSTAPHSNPPAVRPAHLLLSPLTGSLSYLPGCFCPRKAGVGVIRTNI